MTDEPKRVIVLGTVTVEPGEAIAFDIPLDASAEEIAAALAKHEADKAAAQVAESKKLRAMFLTGGDEKAGEKGEAS
jgi:hypothetical protein